MINIYFSPHSHTIPEFHPGQATPRIGLVWCIFPGYSKTLAPLTLLTKVRLVKAVVFPVLMYGYESWTIKKAECLTIDSFELWCWRRLLSPLDCQEIKPLNSKINQY